MQLEFTIKLKVLSRYIMMRTELENLHGRFLLNLSFMQQLECPVKSFF
jgi:hypothetical protein